MIILQLLGRRGIAAICCGLIVFASSGGAGVATAGQSSGQAVPFAWNPVPGANVSGYNLYCGGQSGIYTNVQKLGNVTNATITCAPGATCFIAVTARDSLGNQSPPSNEIKYTVPSSAQNSPIISLPFTAITTALPAPVLVPTQTISVSNNTPNTALPVPPVATVRLAIKTKPSPMSGISSCVLVSATNVIASRWALEASEDLKHWRTLQVGSNSIVNTTVISAGCSGLFFRLRGL